MFEIEGIGNEVLGAATLISVLLSTWIFYLYQNRSTLNVDFGFITLFNWLKGFVHANHTEQLRSEADNLNDQSQPGHSLLYNQDTCPICLNTLNYAALSNCGHVYCCECFMSYWRYGTWLNAVSCPVCRTKVTLLMPCFYEADINDPARDTAQRNIRDYNRRFSNEPRSWWDYVRDVPVLVPNLLGQLCTVGGMMYMFRLRILSLIIVGVLYILSPLDILPEAFLGFVGLLDDLFIGFMLLVYLCVAYRQFLSR